jgi:hypothetical protein
VRREREGRGRKTHEDKAQQMRRQVLWPGSRGGARFKLSDAQTPSKNVISFIEQCRHNAEQCATVLCDTPTGSI